MKLPPDPTNSTETETLLTVLDQQRAMVMWKLEGLSVELAKRALVPSGTTMLGLVKHLGWMERDFFGGDINGNDIIFPWTADTPNGDFDLGPDDTIETVTAFYREAVSESRRIVAGRDMAFVGGTGDHPLSLRYVIVHMIEETARHLGHMDILREQLDGQTGYQPNNG